MRNKKENDTVSTSNKSAHRETKNGKRNKSQLDSENSRKPKKVHSGVEGGWRYGGRRGGYGMGHFPPRHQSSSSLENVSKKDRSSTEAVPAGTSNFGSGARLGVAAAKYRPVVGLAVEVWLRYDDELRCIGQFKTHEQCFAFLCAQMFVLRSHLHRLAVEGLSDAMWADMIAKLDNM